VTVIDLSEHRRKLELQERFTHTLLCASVFPEGCESNTAFQDKQGADRIYRIEPYEEQIDEDHT
jgi:hypothetical protein